MVCNYYILGLALALAQGWVTLFASRATLETNLVYMGQYRHHKDLFNLNFEKKISILGGIFMFYKHKYFMR